MCLDIKKTAKIKTAKEDIICYKYLIKRDDYLTTPFRYAEIKIGETYESTLERCEYSSELHVVEEGLHSFANLEDCDKRVCDCEDDADYEYHSLAKCVIPKGSTYYEGVYGRLKAYASDKIQYLEILK